MGCHLHRLLHQAWLFLKENLTKVDVEAMVQQELSRWSHRLQADNGQAEKLFKLKEENENLVAEARHYKMLVDAIVCTDGNYRSILRSCL